MTLTEAGETTGFVYPGICPLRPTETVYSYLPGAVGNLSVGSKLPAASFVFVKALDGSDVGVKVAVALPSPKGLPLSSFTVVVSLFSLPVPMSVPVLPLSSALKES